MYPVLSKNKISVFLIQQKTKVNFFCKKLEKGFKMGEPHAIETIRLDDANSALVIIDQTLLPNEIKYLHLTTQSEIWEAITSCECVVPQP